MPVESAADRAAFFNPQEFGVLATYSHEGVETPIDGIFDTPFTTVLQDDGGFGVGSRSPSFQCRESDLPAGAGEGDVLSVSGVIWKVAGPIEPDGTGIVTLRLERA